MNVCESEIESTEEKRACMNGCEWMNEVCCIWCFKCCVETCGIRTSPFYPGMGNHYANLVTIGEGRNVGSLVNQQLYVYTQLSHHTESASLHHQSVCQSCSPLTCKQKSKFLQAANVQKAFRKPGEL